MAPMADYHPIARIFPLLSDDELQQLADDIRNNGLKLPIVLFEGKILDGRNRHAACLIAGVKPTFTEFHGTAIEATHHCWSLNRSRRHLNSSQAAVAESKRVQVIKEYGDQVEQMKVEARERKKRKPADSVGETIPPQSREEQKTRTARAKAAGTNPRYIDAADKIVAERPDLAEQIERGEKTIPQAKREMHPLAVMDLGESPQEQARKAPSRRWHAFLHKVYVMLNSIRDCGGIAELTRAWDAAAKADAITELRRIQSEVAKVLLTLEDSLCQRSKSAKKNGLPKQ